MEEVKIRYSKKYSGRNFKNFDFSGQKIVFSDKGVASVSKKTAELLIKTGQFELA